MNFDLKYTLLGTLGRGGFFFKYKEVSRYSQSKSDFGEEVLKILHISL